MERWSGRQLVCLFLLFFDFCDAVRCCAVPLVQQCRVFVTRIALLLALLLAYVCAWQQKHFGEGSQEGPVHEAGLAAPTPPGAQGENPVRRAEGRAVLRFVPATATPGRARRGGAGRGEYPLTLLAFFWYFCTPPNKRCTKCFFWGVENRMRKGCPFLTLRCGLAKYIPPSKFCSG